jgi:hypothetical protein
MADWRQIQAKIRKARASTDAPVELAALYESTRDAMVAFELARLYEKAGSNAEAAQWYTTAAEKFRRAQWKVKAQEALTRLGIAVPLAASEAEAQAAPHSMHTDPNESDSMGSDISGELSAESDSPAEFAAAEASADGELVVEGVDSGMLPAPGEISTGAAGDLLKKRRRRGRRGGRGRRKKPVGGIAADASTAQDPPKPVVRPPSRPSGRPVQRRAPEPVEATPEIRHGVPSTGAEMTSEPESVGTIGPAAWQARRRAGEPALASRLTLLESQLRRLLASPPHSLEDADRAPAGPGVFVLSDSELIDHYYVEACATLRIGIGNVFRSGRNRGGENIRGQLAEHLGITESRVAKYMKDHCAVRWIQLDDESGMLSHFAIAVLKPALNE